MSFKSSPSDEFMKTFRRHDSLNYDKIDVAYGCWVDLKEELEGKLKERNELLMATVKGRKDFRAALRECRSELKALEESQR